MATKQEVFTFISEFKGMPTTALTESTPLGLSSLASQRFRIACNRKLGIELPPGDFKHITVQDILSQVEVGTNLSQTPVKPTQSKEHTKPADQRSEGSPAVSSAVGIDIEHIAQFRKSNDPYADELFRSIFTTSEIGYCLLQSDPPQHFAARFCAKEALRKCSALYRDLPFSEIQVSHHEDGQPYFVLPALSKSLDNISLSLSHTDDFAIAVAVAIGS